jgi:tetratricopeptide (TPR) repeat protein
LEGWQMTGKTMLILIVILGGVGYYGHTQGWFGKATGMQKEVANTFTARFANGNKLYQQEKYPEAIEELKKAYELDSTCSDAAVCLRRIAECYNDMAKTSKDPEDIKKALEYYDKCIEEFPDHKINAAVKNARMKAAELGAT